MTSSVRSPKVDKHVAPTISLAGFVVGVVGIASVLLLVAINPTPTQAQWIVFKIVLALGSAGFAMALTGFISVNMELGKKVAINAGGSLAVFVVVFFWDPASKLVNYGPSLVVAQSVASVDSVAARKAGELGWQASSLKNSPNDAKLVERVRQSFWSLAMDLGVVSSDDAIPTSNRDLVDLVGRRIEARSGPSIRAAFALGALAPAIVEHYDNVQYQHDFMKHHAALHGVQMPDEDQAKLWALIKNSTRKVDDAHRILLSLLEPKQRPNQ